MLKIPLLRRGQPYTSLDVARAPHHATGQPFVEISQAKVGLIRRDLLAQVQMRAALTRLTVRELIDRVRNASDSFLNDTLAIGDTPQRPDDYVEQLSATTGMPFTSMYFL